MKKNMKAILSQIYSSLLLMLLAGLLFSCFSTNDPGDEATPPLIQPVSQQEPISPGHRISIPHDADRIPLSFRVISNTGLRQIRIDVHSAFDGHTHGRTSQQAFFVLLNNDDRINLDDLGNPTDFSVSLEDNMNVFLDDRNPFIDEGFLPLAGPYHFAIMATDINGNQTQYRDNTTYHTTFYLQRPYAPGVEIFFNNNDGLTGKISKTDHSLSTDIVFIWIKKVLINPELPHQDGALITEKLWGESNWRHITRPSVGDVLPASFPIDLSLLTSNIEAFHLLGENEVIYVWVEDERGNITVESIQ